MSETETTTSVTTPASSPIRPLTPEGQAAAERAAAYNALTIGEALNLLDTRRGESQKERKRLMALLDQLDVTKKTTIGEARARAGRK